MHAGLVDTVTPTLIQFNRGIGILCDGRVHNHACRCHANILITVLFREDGHMS